MRLRWPSYGVRLGYRAAICMAGQGNAERVSAIVMLAGPVAPAAALELAARTGRRCSSFHRAGRVRGALPTDDAGMKLICSTRTRETPGEKRNSLAAREALPLELSRPGGHQGTGHSCPYRRGPLSGGPIYVITGIVAVGQLALSDRLRVGSALQGVVLYRSLLTFVHQRLAASASGRANRCAVCLRTCLTISAHHIGYSRHRDSVSRHNVDTSVRDEAPRGIPVQPGGTRSEVPR